MSGGGGSAGTASGRAGAGGHAGVGGRAGAGGYAGAGGRAGAGGYAGQATGGMAGFTCDTPVVPTCDRLQSFSTFGSGDFGGGIFAYGDLSFDTSDSSTFHVTGSVSNWSGFGIYLNTCSTLAAYTGVSFVLSGTIASLDHPNQFQFSVSSNADSPVDAGGKRGACEGVVDEVCIAPAMDLTVNGSPQSVLWTQLSKGKPVATLDPGQVLDFRWEVVADATQTPFSVDLTLDDFTLLGGPNPPTDCPSPAASP
jgi:hypothetical protein